MMNQAARLLNRARKPEYTGENRCVPCTVVNVAIALLASVLVAFVAVSLAAIVFVFSLATIYLRGYLVPRTPALTERYLPDRILSAFDTHPIEETRINEDWETVEKSDRRQKNAIDPEQFLVNVGTVEPCEHEDDLCLTDKFACLVSRRMDAHHKNSIDRETMASLFDTEPNAITILEREYPAVELNRRVRKWPSKTALVADVAADDALRELTDRWTDAPLVQRLSILQSLRSFHEDCPRCSGTVSLSDRTVESCCRTHEVLTIGCSACGDTLLEFGPADLEPHGTETKIQS